MINFQPSEEQELLRQTLAAFARDVVRPQARKADERETVPPAVVEKSWELGLVQDTIPEAFGGYGSPRSAIGGTFVLEELAYGSLGIALHVLAPRLFTMPLVLAGTPAQHAAWLGRFTGSRFAVATAAFTEPRWDFDPTALATTAMRAGGGWTITGEKCAVPLADRAEAILVYATAPDGLAAFVVERGAPGLTIGEREKNMGLRALDLFPVKLEGVKVPDTHRLGGEGVELQPLVDAHRLATAALAVGVGRAAFDYAREYAKERTAFGVPIAQKQAIAFMLSTMAIEIDAARLLAWEAAWRLDRKLPATREAYLAKQYAADAVLKIADNAVQVLGGHGYIRDHLVELFLRDARAFGTLDGLAIV
jgi:alkylation response protein AidB-like acyl-CoA dehydrogenase